MFSSAKDEWSTPADFFARLDAEFGFAADAAALDGNTFKDVYFGPDHPNPLCRDALALHWREVAQANGIAPVYWLNPPYSRARQFIAKAAGEALRGCTVVCLVPARTDTWWFHALVWDREKHRPQPGVEVRFIKGRLKFGGSSNSAPFPSVVIVFRPPQEGK